MSNRTAEANKAVTTAWKQEADLVRQGQGTRDWTPEQQADILTKGKAYDKNGKAFEGHHMKSVEKYPQHQADPNNIQFLTRSEHQAAHNGYFANPTNGRYDPATGKTAQMGEGIEPADSIALLAPINPENAEAIAQLNDLEPVPEGENTQTEDAADGLNHMEPSAENEDALSSENAAANAAVQIDALSPDSSGEESGEAAGADNGASESGGEGVSM